MLKRNDFSTPDIWFEPLASVTTVIKSHSSTENFVCALKGRLTLVVREYGKLFESKIMIFRVLSGFRLV